MMGRNIGVGFGERAGVGWSEDRYRKKRGVDGESMYIFTMNKAGMVIDVGVGGGAGCCLMYVIRVVKQVSGVGRRVTV